MPIGAGTCTYLGPMRQRTYDTLDQLGQSMYDNGISLAMATEDLPFTTTCPNYDILRGSSDNPRFIDTFTHCHTLCYPGQPGCTAQTNPVQTWSVRDIFNAASTAMIKNFPPNHVPLGWVHFASPSSESGLVRHSWMTHVSVNLSNWRSAATRR